ncbi:MAG: DUF4402 domain-containing protein [Pseudomonadota bacterium]
MKQIVVGGVAAAALVASGHASVMAATANFDATAEILEAISITAAQNLGFASILPSATTADTVVIDTAGARTCGAALTCTGTASAASFDVAGTDGATYAITLPAAADITSGANTMQVNGFTSSIGATGTLTGGAETFTVGGTLNVGINQAPGNYTGTFVMTVDYN